MWYVIITQYQCLHLSFSNIYTHTWLPAGVSVTGLLQIGDVRYPAYVAWLMDSKHYSAGKDQTVAPSDVFRQRFQALGSRPDVDLANLLIDFKRCLKPNNSFIAMPFIGCALMQKKSVKTLCQQSILSHHCITSESERHYGQQFQIYETELQLLPDKETLSAIITLALFMALPSTQIILGRPGLLLQVHGYVLNCTCLCFLSSHNYVLTLT